MPKQIARHSAANAAPVSIAGLVGLALVLVAAPASAQLVMFDGLPDGGPLEYFIPR
jgi:hypothetical protein